MINIVNPQDCCGCTACMAICPRNAISMVPDGLGFLYPKVDNTLCIECGLCEKVCSFSSNYDRSMNFDQPLAYAARHRDIHEIETSRSGAVFIALSDLILEKGGIVYGVGYSEHFRVIHKRATSKKERDEFKGSKYVQSDLTGIFRQIKDDLKKGYLVLFSGTPCQTAGLNSFIGKRFRQNLYIIDIVCHGVPSPYIWRDYLSYQEKKYGIIFTKVNFRDKSRVGWSSHRESFESDKIKKEASHFTYLFCKNIMLRHSCEVCPYTNLQRPSDVTIGDFWGWQRIDKNFNEDDKGCSLVFCNTDKGKTWFNTVQHKLYTIPAELNKCLQPNLQRPTTMDPLRVNFENDYIRFGFYFIAKKYGDINIKSYISNIIKKLKRMVRNLLPI